MATAPQRALRLHHYGRPLTFHKPSRLRPEVLTQIKAQVVRIGTNGTRQGFKFAQKMFEAYPELRSL